jgi:hypothetical protein
MPRHARVDKWSPGVRGAYPACVFGLSSTLPNAQLFGQIESKPRWIKDLETHPSTGVNFDPSIQEYHAPNIQTGPRS